MTSRNMILVGALAFSYILMVVYLSDQYPDHGHMFHPITFGIALVGIAIVGLKLGRRGRKHPGIFRVLKVLLASGAVAFAVWMLGSVLLLPVVGYEGFLFVGRPLFFYVLGGVALLVSPLVAKRLA